MPRERFLAHTPDSDAQSLGELSSVRQAENVRCGLTGMTRHGEHRDIPEIADSNSTNAVSFSSARTNEPFGSSKANLSRSRVELFGAASSPRDAISIRLEP